MECLKPQHPACDPHRYYYIQFMFYILYKIDGCSHGDIRLYGGSTDSEGMVQMCNNSTGSASWEAVCDYYWGCYESVIACRQLGYSNAGTCTYIYAFTHVCGL